EVCRKFGLPRLGTHGYGRAGCYPLSGGRRGHDCLACCRCATEAHWEILARSKRNPVVKVTRPSWLLCQAGILPALWRAAGVGRRGGAGEGGGGVTPVPPLSRLFIFF